MTDTLSKETRQLAAMAYGEGSAENNADELYALASVLVRQRNARRYSDIATFSSSEPNFSYVTSDGNKRYSALMKATEQDIEKNAGMKLAIAAATNALNGGVDKSNGAYFWDGADIKSNYSHHFKVKHGIKFTDAAHNIYNIKESTKLVIKYKVRKIRVEKTKQFEIKKDEIGRYDHIYESTAAYGGTIFWRFSKEYLDVTHSKEYL